MENDWKEAVFAALDLCIRYYLLFSYTCTYVGAAVVEPTPRANGCGSCRGAPRRFFVGNDHNRKPLLSVSNCPCFIFTLALTSILHAF